jgi:DNA-binding Lrp family transcriptional regulator
MDAAMTPPNLNALERRLVDEFQHGFPLEARPYARIAEALGVSEREVMEALERLQSRGVVSRVGPVLRPNRLGVSTLAAMAVPADRLEAVAALVSARPEVNHNYEREHRFNLWFVVTAPDRRHLERVLAGLERDTGLAVLDLPMLEDYFIDLGFPLQWT